MIAPGALPRHAIHITEASTRMLARTSGHIRLYIQGPQRMVTVETLAVAVAVDVRVVQGA